MLICLAITRSTKSKEVVDSTRRKSSHTSGDKVSVDSLEVVRGLFVDGIETYLGDVHFTPVIGCSSVKCSHTRYVGGRSTVWDET